MGNFKSIETADLPEDVLRWAEAVKDRHAPVKNDKVERCAKRGEKVHFSFELEFSHAIDANILQDINTFPAEYDLYVIDLRPSRDQRFRGHELKFQFCSVD